MGKKALSFVDKVKVYIKAGNGGDGCLSFRREKYVAKGGPDGGDGGMGGDVIFQASTNVRSLIKYKLGPHITAPNGEKGQGKNMHGRAGKDLICLVPIGTQFFDYDTNDLLYDLDKEHMQYITAKGGIGGHGNTYFKTSIDQAPITTEPGTLGEEFTLMMRLKILADIGIIGKPNAGKSSLLSVISNAKPEIADYPFTTLTPQLGTILHNNKTLVFADIPGLIEHASEGKGLGYDFLSHIERCKILLHLIDINEDIIQQYHLIRNELHAYSTLLTDKPEIIVLNKIDTVPMEDAKAICEMVSKTLNQQVFMISTYAKIALLELLNHCVKKFYNE